MWRWVRRAPVTWLGLALGCVLQVVSWWVTGGGYALGAETAGGNLSPSRVGLFLAGRVSLSSVLSLWSPVVVVCR